MRVSELISRTVPVTVAKGRNLDTVGWCDGYLLVRFRGRGTLYIYGPDVAQADAAKIPHNPYPDALFSKLRKKHEWKCHKVESGVPQANELASREEDARIWERYGS